MEYKVTIRISGIKLTRNGLSRDLYIFERSKTSETLGGAFDELVELAYDAYEEVVSWVTSNPNKADHWFMSSAYPDVRNPKATAENNLGSGGSISPDDEIVRRAIGIRDLEINRALRDIGLNSKPSFIFSAEHRNDLYDLRGDQSPPLEEWRNYGFNGDNLREASKLFSTGREKNRKPRALRHSLFR